MLCRPLRTSHVALATALAPSAALLTAESCELSEDGCREDLWMFWRSGHVRV